MANLMATLMAEYTAAGFTTGTINDRMFALLRSKGGTLCNSNMQKTKKTGGKVTFYFHSNEVP